MHKAVTAAVVTCGCRLRIAAALMVLCALGGCGSSRNDGPPGGAEGRGAIPPEWTAQHKSAATTEAALTNPAAPATAAPPAAAGGDVVGSDATVVAAVDHYQQMVSKLGGKTEVNLDFSRSAITDSDLARLPFPDTVRSIDLSVTQISDAGLEHLLRARRLERLNLAGTQVTLAGVSTLKKMPYLCAVNLDQSQVPLDKQLELLRFFSSRAEARTRVSSP